MQLEENEFTTESLLQYFHDTYGVKLTGNPFNKNDIGQYLARGTTPYRYGHFKITSKKVGGIRVITLEKNELARA
jgi:hypothetical protein